MAAKASSVPSPAPSSPPTSAPWRIRAVQLDLARQRETIEEICRFADFAADEGFNTLLLYLEGVVRTESFPFRPADASYTPAEMSRVVEHAGKRGLEVVPCIATLGHAEHFLSCKELSPLAEAGPNVWGGPMFCPSNEGVYAFLRKYLEEIAAIFPSPHLHIGCDEAWGLGGCPTCRARLDEGLSRDELLVEHLHSMRAILDPLKKRPWIWDDMFENAPESLLRCLPRDLVMCAWTYEAEQIDPGGYRGHFNNLRRRDWLSIYARLGFEVLLCPATFSPRATQALTRYGRRGPVAGGLQTMWELSGAFLPSQLPGVALAGQLWSNASLDVDAGWTQTLVRLLPDLTPAERAAAGVAAIEQPSLTGGPWPASVLRGPLNHAEARAVAGAELAALTLGPALQRLAPGRQRDIVEDLLLRLRELALWGRVRRDLADRVDPRMPLPCAATAARELDARCAEMLDLATCRAEQWQRHRPGIGPDHASPHHRHSADALRALAAQLDASPPTERAMLDLQLFLWDAFSGPRLVVELACDGTWREVFAGSFKPADVRSPLPYHLRIPLRQIGPPDPDKLRLRVAGFGGQGVCFANVVMANRTLAPVEVLESSGMIANAEAALIDDSSFAYLGSPDTTRALMNQTHKAESALTLRLARDEQSDRPR